MKRIFKIAIAFIMTIALAIPLAVPASAYTEEDPFVVDLIAGQNMVVGDVKVWNDGNDLYVKYELNQGAIDDGWEITETHLYIGKNAPPTSAPGQFPYNDDDAPGVPDTEVLYTIPLDSIDSYSMQLNKKGKETGVMIADGNPGMEYCHDVFIAAHAVIEKCETEKYTEQPELEWQRSAEIQDGIAHFPGYGGQWDPITEGFTIPLDPSQMVWDNGIYHTPPGTPTGSYASWNYKGILGVEGPGWDQNYGSDLRRFQATFDMPDGCIVTGGKLSTIGFNGIPINDNVYVFVDGDLIFWGGTRVNQIPDGLFQGMAGIQALRGSTQPAETDRWYIPGTLPALTNLTTGTNYIDVFTEENERWGGIGELFLSLDCEQTTCQTETAWGNGTLINVNSNWSMYFTYHPQPVPETWPLAGTATIGYEDLPLGGGDHDYNDFVSDITVVGYYFGGELVSIVFTFDAEAVGASYTHDLNLLIPADTFDSDGVYEITYKEHDGSILSTSSGTFDSESALDLEVFSNTHSAQTNWQTYDGSGVNPGRTTEISIDFDEPFSFDLGTYDPGTVGVHGTGLFFDPYLYVHDTSQYIHTGDTRLIVVPTDWQWPQEGAAIWNVYPYDSGNNRGVQSGMPPTFVNDWYNEGPASGLEWNP